MYSDSLFEHFSRKMEHKVWAFYWGNQNNNVQKSKQCLITYTKSVMARHTMFTKRSDCNH